jgi:hypothetical protein
LGREATGPCYVWLFGHGCVAHLGVGVARVRKKVTLMGGGVSLVGGTIASLRSGVDTPILNPRFPRHSVTVGDTILGIPSFRIIASGGLASVLRSCRLRTPAETCGHRGIDLRPCLCHERDESVVQSTLTAYTWRTCLPLTSAVIGMCFASGAGECSTMPRWVSSGCIAR